MVPMGNPVDGPITQMPMGPTTPHYRVWASGEYLLWRISDPQLPSSASAMPAGLLAVTTTITTLPPPPAPFAQTTFLPIGTTGSGNPGGVANLGEHNGARFTAGLWFDQAEDCGVEASFFILERRSYDFATIFSNTGNVNGAFVINTGLASTTVVTTQTGPVAAPTTTTTTYTNPVILGGTSTGNLNGFLRNEMLGGDLNARATCSYFGPVKISGTAGFRYLFYGEDYQLNDQFTVTLTNATGAAVGGVVPALPTNILGRTVDAIKSHNNFFGGQAGFELEGECCSFFIDGKFHCALGANEQSVNITAVTLAPTVMLGGSTYGAGDVGNHERTRISVIPEVNLRVGYVFNDNIRAWVGYDGMYMYNVVRAAGQSQSSNPISVVVGSTNVPVTVNQFSFHFVDSNLPVQGINFGLEFRF
jgi:Putative beta barrel porin-7 (BBP7)